MACGLDDVTWVQSACHGINRDMSTVKPRGKIRTSIVQAIGLALQGQRPLSLTLIPIRGHNARLGPDIKFQCLCVGFEPLSKLVLRRKDLCCERIVTLTFDLSSDLPASSEGNSDRACDRTLALISTVGLSASESRNPREEKRTRVQEGECSAQARNDEESKLTKQNHVARAGDTGSASCHQCVRCGR